MKVLIRVDSHVSFNYIKLRKDDKKVIKELKETFSHTNPVYIKFVRMGLPTDKEPEIYESFERVGKRIKFKRGCFSKIKKILRKRGHELKIKYNRTKRKTKYNSKIELRKEQVKAVDAILKYKQGIVRGPCSSGKSVIGLEAIARSKQVGLVVVWEKIHQIQWIKEALRNDLLNIKIEDIGGMGGIFSKKKDWEQALPGIPYPGNKKVNKLNICMLQSLRNESNQELYFPVCGILLADECLGGDTLIAIPSGHKKISELCEGDEVLTHTGKMTKIKNIWTTVKTAYCYKTKYGQDLIASKDHIVSTMVSGQKTFGPSNRSSRYENLKIKEAKNLRPFKVKRIIRDINPESVLLGWIIADANFSNNFFKFGLRKKSKIDLLQQVIKNCGIQYKKFVNQRGDTVISIPVKDSKYLYERLSFNKINKTKTIKIPDELFNVCDPGILRGLFDADGCFTGNYVELDSISEDLITQVQQMLSSLGVPNKINIIKRKNKKHSTVYRLTVTSKAVEYFYYNIFSDLEIRRKKMVDFITSKKIYRNAWKHNEIIKVEKIGKRKLYDIELTNKDRLFVANGYVVHNCQRFAAATFNSTIVNCPAKYRIGLSADETRNDEREFLIYDAFGEIIHIIPDKDIGSRIPARINLLPTNYSNSDYEDVSNPVELAHDMARDKKRNRIIINRVLQKVKKKKLILIFVERRWQGLYLRQKLLEKNLRVKLLVGKVTKKEINETEDWEKSWKDFMLSYDDNKEFFDIVDLGTKKKLDVVITNRKGIAGLSIRTFDHGMCCIPINIKDFNQMKGRIERNYDKQLEKIFGKKKKPSMDFMWDIKSEKLRRKGKTILNIYANVSVLQRRLKDGKKRKRI